jgi:isopentenyl-diphosphate Delta-isomerase
MSGYIIPQGKSFYRSARMIWKYILDAWDITCTGHVRAGEELKSAAHREVLEELGITIDESKLKYVEMQKNITSHADKQKGIINTYYHLNHVFLLKYDLSHRT